MVTDDATCRGAEDTMVAGKMTGSAAYQGALDAPFGISRGCDRKKEKRCDHAGNRLAHFLSPKRDG
jgi:hypothetical protein